MISNIAEWPWMWFPVSFSTMLAFCGSSCVKWGVLPCHRGTKHGQRLLLQSDTSTNELFKTLPPKRDFATFILFLLCLFSPRVSQTTDTVVDCFEFLFYDVFSSILQAKWTRVSLFFIGQPIFCSVIFCHFSPLHWMPAKCNKQTPLYLPMMQWFWIIARW